ncbi:sacsin N-terminal ATP-binding-like domain-containing protein [Gelatiniphilus marinus]|uniref:Sacsin N-terminal ATP-binding-like domain-containing protein n=1 Tax=Gelatiniphilus marinus TaxID=1759464 RepID=A0ABW5JVB1_9FLAO
MSTIDEDKEDVLVENNAQFIYQHIRSLENEIDKNGSRWFWELLQNAKDAKDANTIEVALDYNNGKVVFKHTGKEFTRKEILHLIYHGSTKKGDPTKTGKFGTGFMTTHLLSKKVDIKGKLLEKDKCFEFTLDRTGNSSDELRETLEESYDNFKDNSDYPFNPNQVYNTQFTYTINPTRTNLVENVINTLKLTIPFVLASSEEIGKLLITNREDNFDINRLGENELNPETSIKEYKIKVQDENISILKLENETVIEFEYNTEDGEKSAEENIKLSVNIEVNDKKVLRINRKTPCIYYDFPLVTTDSFKFPAIINSLSFSPKTERDGIYLSVANTYDVNKNKAIFKEAFGLYVDLLDGLINNNFLNVHFLCELKSINIPEVDNDWYNKQLKSLIEKFFDKRVLMNNEDDPIILKDAFIPTNVSEELNGKYWSLIQELYPNKVVKQEIHKDWLKILKSWDDFEFDKFSFELTLNDVAKIIEKEITLQSFTNSFFNNDYDKAYSWLNDFYSIIKQIQQPHLFESYSIIANQNGNFVKKEATLNTDGGIDNKLKDILELLDEDIRKNLIDVELSFPNITKKSQEEVFDKTLAKVIEIESYFTEKEYAASMDMFSWLLANSKIEKLENFPVSYANHIEGNRDIYRLSNKNTILAPVENWEEIFRDYKELFSDDFILNSDYKDIIKDVIVELEKSGFIYAQPLYYEKHSFNQDDLKKVISKKLDDDFWEREDENSTLEIPEVLVSKIPFFYSEDKAVLNNSRKANKRTSQLLEFITECILVKDTKLFEEVQIEIYGQPVSIYPSIWIARLKNRQWVNIGKDKSETATSSNLSDYFEKSPLLSEKLKDEKTAKFLNIIGVSVGDLTKNIYAKTDEEKFEWDKAYTSILSAGHNNQVTPEEVLGIFNDPALIEEIKKKRKEKTIVKNNRDIGLTIEDIFEQVIDEELSQSNLNIKKEVVGRDFDIVEAVEIENDFIDEKTGFENILVVNNDAKSYAIELKSTRTDYIRMTKAQGQLSTSKKNEFALCVFSHSLDFENFRDEEGNVKESIKNEIKSNVRFVTNIGVLLTDEVNKVKELDNQVAKTRTINNDIDVDIEEGQIKYKVKEAVWSNGIPLSDFIDEMKKVF